VKKIATIVSTIAILVGAAWLGRNYLADIAYRAQQPTLPPAVERSELPTIPVVEQTDGDTTASSTNDQQPTTLLPESFNLVVSFTTQAPNSNWSQPYQDSCEEASVITVHYFWSDQIFTPAKADAEILKFVAFENDQLGSPTGYLDTDAATTASLVERYWPQYRTRVVYDWTIKDVETEIAAGHPVVAFFAGKELHNPNFKNGGPLYHALVIKGYTPTQFITNDVGTRRGADYVYAKQVLLDASHDWNDGDVANGRRVMLIIEPR
jgi:hypothetical protein